MSVVRLSLRDDQWERMALHLPGKAGGPGRSGTDNRLFVEAVLWLARTGSPWSDLPGAFGKANSVFVRFLRWSTRGVWDRLFAPGASERLHRGRGSHRRSTDRACPRRQRLRLESAARRHHQARRDRRHSAQNNVATDSLRLRVILRAKSRRTLFSEAQTLQAHCNAL
ncbi:MAG: putative transposase of ISAli9, family subgroup [Hyphomicrobiales bacterium]|nr:putative transposase of ISAli9, family subgroup [Hyphomicrobiales bacterium]